MSKPRVLVARAVFPETIERLQRHFDVASNQEDADWSAPELAVRLKGMNGALTTGSVRVDDALLAACPDLKICANMAVGYNNFDIEAMARRGVVATNT
ncbi:MAG: D-glycerate dehydrogenase, partial [Alcaligenaceae bacterium]